MSKKREGDEASLANSSPSLTERSTMKNHGRKEPPLQAQVNHKARLKSNISYYMSMTFFIVVVAFTFASVFDA